MTTADRLKKWCYERDVFRPVHQDGRVVQLDASDLREAMVVALEAALFDSDIRGIPGTEMAIEVISGRSIRALIASLKEEK